VGSKCQFQNELILRIGKKGAPKEMNLLQMAECCQPTQCPRAAAATSSVPEIRRAIAASPASLQKPEIRRAFPADSTNTTEIPVRRAVAVSPATSPETILSIMARPHIGFGGTNSNPYFPGF